MDTKYCYYCKHTYVTRFGDDDIFIDCRCKRNLGTARSILLALISAREEVETLENALKACTEE